MAWGNEKGRVERAIRHIREAFFIARKFKDLDDLNAQAEQWCRNQAADRPCPEDRTMTIRQVFAQEQPMLVPLPANPYPIEEQIAAKVGKTPYVRFDLNDYSVPHTHVRRTLTVRADLAQVRIFDAATMIASHRRSYDRGQQIEDPRHLKALVAVKREARQHRGLNSLTHAVPACQKLMIRAAERGANIGAITNAMLKLLDLYGATELQGAVEDALQAGASHSRSVRVVLERRRIARGAPRPSKQGCQSMSAKRIRSCSPTSSTVTINSHPQATTMNNPGILFNRARALRLNGLIAHWDEIADAPWLAAVLQWEEEGRSDRSLRRRMRAARLGHFKQVADYDWKWPRRIDRAAIDSDSMLRRKLQYYAAPDVLVIDEVGYLSYSNRHADLLFDLISRRYEKRSTIVTTNKPFA